MARQPALKTGKFPLIKDRGTIDRRLDGKLKNLKKDHLSQSEHNQIQRPVILLYDGHSSRFDYKVLRFLRENKIDMFVSPPDTTGVTQLLDQAPNSKLHQGYNSTKDKLFTPFQTINREGLVLQCGMNGLQKRT